jgi:hypothetical protein
VNQEQVVEILWGAFLVQERRPDVENEKAPEICVNKGYREFVGTSGCRGKASRSSDWHFPFFGRFLYILLSCAKRLSEAGERTTVQRASTLNSYCTLQKF